MLPREKSVRLFLLKKIAAPAWHISGILTCAPSLGLFGCNATDCRTEQMASSSNSSNVAAASLEHATTADFQACIEDGTVSQIVRQHTLAATAALTLAKYVTFTAALKFCLRLVSPYNSWTMMIMMSSILWAWRMGRSRAYHTRTTSIEPTRNNVYIVVVVVAAAVNWSLFVVVKTTSLRWRHHGRRKPVTAASIRYLLAM